MVVSINETVHNGLVYEFFQNKKGVNRDIDVALDGVNKHNIATKCQLALRLHEHTIDNYSFKTGIAYVKAMKDKETTERWIISVDNDYYKLYSFIFY